MKYIVIISMILLTACKPPARTDVECKPMSEPEIITEARKAVDEEGDDAGRMLAQLFLNAVKSGMTQDEVLRALGTSRWVKDCSFTQFRKGVVPVRTMIGDGDQRQQISVIGLDFYIRDGKDRERWGAWIGLSNFTGSIHAAEQFFIGDDHSLPACYIDELAIFHISKDGRMLGSVTKRFDGGLAFDSF